MKARFLLTMVLCAAITVVFAQSDVLSSKQNIPVKKESFTTKLERYKTEGFKVAVVLISDSIITKPGSGGVTADALKQIMLEGKLPPIKDHLGSIIESFTAKMNEAFSTDLFEVVDASKIPTKETGWVASKDWGTTIYRLVITYDITPQYDYNFLSMANSRFNAKLIVPLTVYVNEYVNTKKGVKTKAVAFGNFGTFKSEEFESNSNPEVESIEELQSLVNPPPVTEIAAALQELQDAGIDRFIEKRLKK